MSAPDHVRALPLHQPWASLVMLGAKRIETRPGPAPRTILGQRIVVHAAKTPYYWFQCGQPVFNEHVPSWGALPRGALLGTVEVVGHHQMKQGWVDRLERNDPQEFVFGDYAEGRWAWLLSDPQPFPQPIPRRREWGGGQGIFLVPPEVVGLVGVG